MFGLDYSSCWCSSPRQHATASNGQHKHKQLLSLAEHLMERMLNSSTGAGCHPGGRACPHGDRVAAV